MKEFEQRIRHSYLKGIKDGKVTVLFFKQKIFDDIHTGDLIKFHSFGNQAKVYFVKDKNISFNEVTDEIAQKAGFINTDLLAEHLATEFDIDTLIFTDTKECLQGELFYMVVISDDPISDDSTCVDKKDDASDIYRCCGKRSKYWMGNLTLRNIASRL